jgi:hypothetical protein
MAMEQQDVEQKATESTDQASTGHDGAIIPRKHPGLANLRPPWRKGQSGNPSGLASDGKGSKDHPIRAQLRAKLAKRREVRRLVETWWEAACNGDSKAREQILERLDPIEKDSAQGKVILEGLRLELTAHDGSTTTLSMGSTQVPEQQALSAREVELEPPSQPS